MKHFAPFALASILVLTVAGPALAANASASTAETLSVGYTTSITGVPATLDYGTGLAGTFVYTPKFTITVSTNDPNGLTLSWLPTAMTSGSDSIAAVYHYVYITASTGLTVQTGTYSFNSSAAPGMTIASGTTAVANGTMDLELVVNVPTTQPAGSYSGTSTFTVSEN